MKKTETEQILEYLKHIDESINGPRPKARPPKKEPPLSKRVDTLDKKVGGLGKKVEGLDRKVGGLGEKLDKLDDRVSEVQLGLATLAADTKAQFQRVDERFTKIDERFTKIDERFDSVDVQFAGVRGAIESTRVQLMDLVGSVRSELTGRIIDLEGPGTKGSGGGVPLAS
jgi:archaellum component FlaC